MSLNAYVHTLFLLVRLQYFHGTESDFLGLPVVVSLVAYVSTEVVMEDVISPMLLSDCKPQARLDFCVYAHA